jgi:hypothetical protein
MPRGVPSRPYTYLIPYPHHPDITETSSVPYIHVLVTPTPKRPSFGHRGKEIQEKKTTTYQNKTANHTTKRNPPLPHLHVLPSAPSLRLLRLLSSLTSSINNVSQPPHQLGRVVVSKRVQLPATLTADEVSSDGQLASCSSSGGTRGSILGKQLRGGKILLPVLELCDVRFAFAAQLLRVVPAELRAEEPCQGGMLTSVLPWLGSLG